MPWWWTGPCCEASNCLDEAYFFKISSAGLIEPLHFIHGNVNSFPMEDKHFYLRNSHLLFPDVQRRLLAWTHEGAVKRKSEGSGFKPVG